MFSSHQNKFQNIDKILQNSIQSLIFTNIKDANIFRVFFYNIHIKKLFIKYSQLQNFLPNLNLKQKKDHESKWKMCILIWASLFFKPQKSDILSINRAKLKYVYHLPFLLLLALFIYKTSNSCLQTRKAK